jgi:hypothetical protein
MSFRHKETVPSKGWFISVCHTQRVLERARQVGVVSSGLTLPQLCDLAYESRQRTKVRTIRAKRVIECLLRTRFPMYSRLRALVTAPQQASSTLNTINPEPEV